jgi:hypothetical protein
MSHTSLVKTLASGAAQVTPVTPRPPQTARRLWRSRWRWSCRASLGEVPGKGENIGISWGKIRTFHGENIGISWVKWKILCHSMTLLVANCRSLKSEDRFPRSTVSTFLWEQFIIGCSILAGFVEHRHFMGKN